MGRCMRATGSRGTERHRAMPDGRGSKIHGRCFCFFCLAAAKAFALRRVTLSLLVHARRRSGAARRSRPEGRGTRMCRVKKSNPKKRFTAAEWLVMADQAHPAFAPAAALRVRGANGIFGRDSSAMRPSPGHSPRGECPPAGAKRCFAFSGEPMCAALRVFPIGSAASEGPRRSDIRRPWRLARRRARRCYPSRATSRATATAVTARSSIPALTPQTCPLQSIRSRRPPASMRSG